MQNKQNSNSLKIKNLIIVILLLLAILLLVINFTSRNTITDKLKIAPLPTKQVDWYKVREVVDGDTIVLDSGNTVRYLGLDTPELHHPTTGEECGGKEAKEENVKLVSGKKIKLEKDITEKDQYGRLLRFVFTTDGEFVNYQLVRKGWGQVLSIPPDKKFEKVFIDAQLTAKKETLGIWSKCFKGGESR